jgi:hypothetical protein
VRFPGRSAAASRRAGVGFGTEPKLGSGRRDRAQEGPTNVWVVDFFHVDCSVTCGVSTSCSCLRSATRHLHVLGRDRYLDGPRTTQQARNLVMDLGEQAARFRFLVRD